MTDYTVTPVAEGVAETYGEGPFWDSQNNTLFSVSIGDGKVHMWEAESQELESMQLGGDGESVSFVIPCEGDGFVAGVNQRIVHFDWNAGDLVVRTLHEVEAGEPTRFNDAKCDPAGRLVAGTMSLEKEPAVVQKPDAGSLYGLDASGLKKLDSGFSISNGMGWCGDKFFFAESVSRQIFAYDWDSDAFSVANRRVVVDFNSLPNADQIGVPDGMTVDASGRLWVACFFGSRVVCIDPEVGKIVNEVRLPVEHITSCCFGGANLDELFVTSGKVGAKADQPLAGSIFKVTGLGVKGTPSVPYKGPV